MARILVIDDNETNLDLMTYLLQAFGHTSLSANTGEMGLEIAQRERPDLIICDIQMPGMDGYEVAQQLSRHPVLGKIPRVAVTALAMVGDRDKVLAAGFNGYISKPIAPETFVGQAEAFLQSNQRAAVPPQPQLEERTTDPRPPLAKHTIVLVVDNSPVNLQLMSSTLEPFGYEVVTADSVSQGLALARQLHPDLILSDLHMPSQNGYDFIRAVKLDPELRHTPFVFISSTIWREKDRTDGLALGADGFILRPIEPETLLQEIKTYVKKDELTKRENRRHGDTQTRG